MNYFTANPLTSLENLAFFMILGRVEAQIKKINSVKFAYYENQIWLKSLRQINSMLLRLKKQGHLYLLTHTYSKKLHCPVGD